MQKRVLGSGSGDLEASATGLGQMGMTQSYGPTGIREESIALIRSAAERVVTTMPSPVEFVFVQKQLVQGIATTGIEG